MFEGILVLFAVLTYSLARSLSHSLLFSFFFYYYSTIKKYTHTHTYRVKLLFMLMHAHHMHVHESKFPFFLLFLFLLLFSSRIAYGVCNIMYRVWRRYSKRYTVIEILKGKLSFCFVSAFICNCLLLCEYYE